MKKMILILSLFIFACDEGAQLDCAGVEDGSASLDDCGLCTGGTTNLEINYLKDDCGVCGGDNSTCSGCTDSNAENYDVTAIIDDGSCISSSVTFYPDFTVIMQRDSNGNNLGIIGDSEGVFSACYEQDLYRSSSTTEDINPIEENMISGLYPNPFQNNINIEFALATDGNVRIIVINQSNEVLGTILNEQKSAGVHQLIWDGSFNNELLSNGYYRVILDFGDLECFENIKFEYSEL